jgi:hypothetical protein
MNDDREKNPDEMCFPTQNNVGKRTIAVEGQLNDVVYM